MSEVPMISMWMGQNVDDLTREEAIAALKECGRQLTVSYEGQASAWKFHREVMSHFLHK